MRIQSKPVLIFTEEEYMKLFNACQVLQDVFNEDLADAFNEALGEDDDYLNVLYEMFANVVDYVEVHREEY